MKYKIYPKGYDPMVANGPPGDDVIKIGMIWTEEDTQRMKELEAQAFSSESIIHGQWYEVEEEDVRNQLCEAYP